MPDVTNELLTDDPARHGVGGNNPPSPVEMLRTRLTEEHADMIKRSKDLLAMLDRLPAAMDDEWEKKISEAIKSCAKFLKHNKAARLHENEKFRDLIATSDGFYKGMYDPVEALKTKLNVEYLTPYQRKKSDEEQARRDAVAAEAKRLADEQQRIAREEAARVAEAKRKEAEAKAEAERLERERQEAERLRAEEERLARERLEAARREEEQRQEATRREAERMAAEAKNRQEREAAAAARAKADREAAEARAKADREAAEAKAKADRERAIADAEAQRKAAEARAEIEKAEAERREAEAKAKAERDALEKVKAEKAAAEKAAAAKAADMSRVRTDNGAISSLRTTWHHRLIDGQEDKIPDIYWSVNEGAIAAAVKAATTKDDRCTLKIPGVEIYSKTESVTR